RPQGIAITPDRKIIVVESRNSRVQIFDKCGNPITCIYTNRLNSVEFCEPQGVCIDIDGNIAVVDQQTGFIQVF
ncbi:hypothetical protein A3Q56_07080, partial [Intoshia linei]